MKQIRSDVSLLKILYFLAVGIIVFQVIGQNSLTSLLFYMTFPVTLLLWMWVVKQTLNSMDIIVFFTIMLAFVSVLLDAMMSNANLSFSYLKKLIIFSMTLVFLQTGFRMRIDQEMVRFITRIVDFLIVFLVVSYFLGGRQMYTVGGRISRYLTFRIGNPNMTGLYLTCLYMLELCMLFATEKWYWKVARLLMATFLAMFILLTQSRNCLLVMVLFTLIWIWLLFRGRQYMYISRTAAMVLATLPILLLTGYILLVYTPWIQNFFDFLVSEGKDLDSRMDIWKPALDALQRSPVIGAYHDISKGKGMSQMHNSHLDIAVSYGVPVLFLVCTLLYKYLYQKGKKYLSKQSYSYILGFACAIILGVGEAALFSGGLSLYVFVGSFLLMINWEQEEKSVG